MKNYMRIHDIVLNFENLGKIVKDKCAVGTSEVDANLFLLSPRYAGKPICMDELEQAYVNLVAPNQVEPIVIECDTLGDEIYLIPAEEFVDAIGTYTADLSLRFIGNRKMVSPKFTFEVVETNERG